MGRNLAYFKIARRCGVESVPESTVEIRRLHQLRPQTTPTPGFECNSDITSTTPSPGRSDRPSRTNSAGFFRLIIRLDRRFSGNSMTNKPVHGLCSWQRKCANLSDRSIPLDPITESEKHDCARLAQYEPGSSPKSSFVCQLRDHQRRHKRSLC